MFNFAKNSNTSNFLKLYLISFFAFLFLISSVSSIVFANHIVGTYPFNGFLYMSGQKSYAGTIFVTSTNCNPAETGAYAKIKSSTTGTTQMSRWVNGIKMSQYTCTGVWNNFTDIKLNYLPNFTSLPSHGSEGGHTHAWAAGTSSSPLPNFCQANGASYPCGTISEVHINKPKWDTTSSMGRERLIIHETGHSHRLQHHCTSNSIMNDGTSVCNGGAWTSVMTYQPTDRTGINSIYP